MSNEKCLYDQWLDGTAAALNTFTNKLFQAFAVADGVNRGKLIRAFPELFQNSENI